MFHSTLRVLIMMIGELDYGTIFVDNIAEENSSSQNPKNPFPSMAFFFIFLCLFLLTVSLMNLLVRIYPVQIAIINVDGLLSLLRFASCH